MTEENKRLARVYDQLERVVDWLDRAEVILTSLFMVVIVTMGCMEIFSRYVLDKSLFFVYEVTILLANWMYFLGFCLVFRRNRDIEIEFFVQRLSPRARKLVSFLGNLACFAFLLMLSWYAVKLLIIQSRHTTEGLGIPNHYFSMPILIGSLNILLISIQRLLGICIEKQEV